MKYCEDYTALLDLYVDGELSPEEMAEIQAHLDSCPGCQAYVDDALAIRAAFPDTEDAEVPAGFAEGVMSAIRAQQPQAAPQKRKLSKILLPLAACCAIVLLVRGVGFPGGSKSEPAADTAAFTMAESCMEEPAAQAEDSLDEYEYAQAAAEARFAPQEAAKNATEDAASPYFAILTLPPDALEMELLADGAPISETDGERRYELSAEDYAVLLDQLDAAGIQPAAREQANAESGLALVIVTGL